MSDKTQAENNESASLIGRLGSSAFRLSTTAVSMSPRLALLFGIEWEVKEHHMAIEKDLLDQLLAGRDPKDVFNNHHHCRSVSFSVGL